MATVETKSIEISYKANIADLKAKLATIPDLTAQEAKKMVSALDRQLKQAEKAAKKSADASQKAARAASKAARDGAKDFDRMALSADHVADSAGDIDRGFSGIETALRNVNPQLAELAGGFADAFAASESMLVSVSALNPVVLGTVGVLAGLTVGILNYNEAAKKAESQNYQLRQAQIALSNSMYELTTIVSDSGRLLQEQQFEYDVLTGKIGEYDAAIQRAEMGAQAQFEGSNKALQARIRATEQDIEFLERYARLQGRVSEEEQARFDALQQSLAVREGAGYGVVLEAANMQLKTQNALLQNNSQLEQAAIELARDRAQYEWDAAQAAKEKNTTLKDTVALQEDYNALLEEALKTGDDDIKQYQAKKELQKILRDATATDLQKESDAINEKYQKELENIELLGLISGEEALARDAEIQFKMDRNKELHDLIMSNLNTEKESYGQYWQALADGAGNFAGASIQAMQDMGGANADVIKGLFRMQQVASTAQVGFSTAEAIAKALTYPPPFNAIMAATAAATGAAQIASIAAQPIPQQSFHMGGTIAPDEQRATVLTGEAVLDRTTVRNLGGEQGIRDLQNQTQESNVMVIQPWKHIDRYNRSARRRTPRRVGSGRY